MSNYSRTSSITEDQITTPRIHNIDIMNFWLRLFYKIICVNFQLPNDIQSFFKSYQGQPIENCLQELTFISSAFTLMLE